MDLTHLEARNYRSFPACLFWLIPYLILGGIALYWPAHGDLLGWDFRDSSWVREVPSVAAYVRKSDFPAATAAYLALSAIAFLPTFFIAVCSASFLFTTNEEVSRYFKRFERWPPALMCSITSLIAALAILVFWGQPGYDFELLPISERRWALALGGPWCSFYSMSFYLVSLAVQTVRLWLQVAQEVRNGLE